MTGVRPNDAGFTLIEALVAMAILAVAAGGLIRATESQADVVRALQSRAIAQWVAENRMVELSLAGNAAALQNGPVEMLGRRWRVAVTSRSTEDPDLNAVDVAVVEDNTTGPAVTLRGFIDTGSVAP